MSKYSNINNSVVIGKGSTTGNINNNSNNKFNNNKDESHKEKRRIFLPGCIYTIILLFLLIGFSFIFKIFGLSGLIAITTSIILTTALISIFILAYNNKLKEKGIVDLLKTVINKVGFKKE